MRTIVPGHLYEVQSLSGGELKQVIQFEKRIGDRYPGNKPPSFNGTNCQELTRVLINRCRYLNNQIPCAETEAIIHLYETALMLFEIRAKRCKKRTLQIESLQSLIEEEPCRECGHVLCEHTTE
jgi:hypothetical protein